MLDAVDRLAEDSRPAGSLPYGSPDLRRLRTDGCSPRRHRPEAELWVIEQENLHRNWLVTGVRLDAGEAG